MEHIVNNDPFNPNGPQNSNPQPEQPVMFQATPTPVTPVNPISPTTQAAPAGVDPGKTLGIVGIVLAFVANLIGLILSIISLSKSKKAGFKGTLGLVGIILNALTMIVGSILFFLFFFVAIPAIQSAQRNLEERASSSITQPTTNEEPDSSLDSSSPSTEAARLNTLGTVADQILQQNIIAYISAMPATGSSVTSKDVTAIRSTQVDATTYDEEWDVKVGSKTNTYAIHLVSLASGGTELSVKLKS